MKHIAVSQRPKLRELPTYTFSWRYHSDYIVSGDQVYFVFDRNRQYTIPYPDESMRERLPNLVTQQSIEYGVVIASANRQDSDEIVRWKYDFLQDELTLLAPEEIPSPSSASSTSALRLVSNDLDSVLSLQRVEVDEELANWEGHFGAISLNNEDIMYIGLYKEGSAYIHPDPRDHLPEWYPGWDTIKLIHYDVLTNTHTELYEFGPDIGISPLALAPDGSTAIVNLYDRQPPITASHYSNIWYNSVLHLFDLDRQCLIDEYFVEGSIINLEYSASRPSSVAFTKHNVRADGTSFWFLNLDILLEEAVENRPCLDSVNTDYFADLVVFEPYD